MEWVVRYTTIKEEEARDEGAGQYQVRVRFNSENMTFNVTPNEPYMSLKEKVATRTRLHIDAFYLRRSGVPIPDSNWTLKRLEIRSGQLLDVEISEERLCLKVLI